MLRNMIVHMHKPSTRAGRLAHSALVAYQGAGLGLAVLVMVGCLVGIPLLGALGAQKALVRPAAASVCKDHPPIVLVSSCTPHQFRCAAVRVCA